MTSRRSQKTSMSNDAKFFSITTLYQGYQLKRNDLQNIIRRIMLVHRCYTRRIFFPNRMRLSPRRTSGHDFPRISIVLCRHR